MRPDGVTVTQDGVAVLVHTHSAAAVTPNAPVTPVGGADTVVGVTVPQHGVVLAAGCVTVNVRPAIVAVPERWALPVLAATVMLTLPLPAPLEPALTVSHEALLVAVQVQELAAVTVAVVTSPPAAAVRLVGDTV